ncbi:MAG: VCBS repeat-containing protein [Prevotella sp.]|nr:VCBS repeat-containing protein [Prevotella sp.]MBR6138044.1 VCBS repeat-containing protein [Prevotella sp.]MDO4979573.1 FG-GAP-like repeat-containing protein [Prevotellaceae bacterium]
MENRKKISKHTIYKIFVLAIFAFYQSVSYAYYIGDSISTAGTNSLPHKPIEPGEPIIPKDSLKVDDSFIDIEGPTDPNTPTVNPFNPGIPNVSSNYDVGNTSGSFVVNGVGAAEYSLPISCPNGGSLTPQIGLKYSSQSACYGMAGYGFTVTGISSITRGSKTLFNNNGSIGGVNYTADDFLFLDGKRLVLVSGNECQEGATYCLEGDPYTKVIAHGTYSDTSATTWFEVKTSDGKIYQYGHDGCSRLIYTNSNGIQHIASWNVNRIEDVHGNYITYTYSVSNLYAYLTSIVYGTNKNKDRGITCRIDFEYQSIGVSPYVFNIEGKKGMIDKCISSITSSCNDKTYRQYLLTYDTHTDQSTNKFARLVSVQEKNSSGESLKPVCFNWGFLPARNVFLSQISTDTSDGGELEKEKDKYFFSTDINRDGVSDIIKISSYEGNSISKTILHVSQSSISSTGDLSFLNPIKFPLPCQSSFCGTTSIFEGFSTLDFDGDGFNDIIVPFHNYSDGEWNVVELHMISGYDLCTRTVSNSSRINVPITSKEKIPLLACFDTDGDGKDDIICVDQVKKNGTYPAVILKDGVNTSIDNTEFTVSLPQEPLKMFSGDYNNDGLIDIIILYKGGYKIYYNNGGNENIQKFSEQNCYSSDGLEEQWRMEQGDFDGDGLLDFVYYRNKETWLWVARNNGDGTFTCTATDDIGMGNHRTSNDDDKFAVRVWDIDHDGRSDVMVCKPWYMKDQYAYTEVRTLYSNGTTLILGDSIVKFREDDAKESYIFLGDFNGDGHLELANYGSNLLSTDDTFTENVINVYKNSTDLSQTGKVTKITDSMGNSTDISYSYTTTPAVYSRTSGTNSQYPVNTYTLPLSVVKSTTSTNGAAGSQTVNYSYKDFKIHLAGAGALGFSEMSRNNTATGETSTTSITSWNTNRWIPSTTKETRTVSEAVATAISTMSVVNVGNTYFAYESSRATTDFDGNTATTTTHYDTEKGVVTDQTVSNDGSNMYKKAEYSGFQQKSGVWLPTVMTMTQKHADDTAPFSAITTYTYDDRGNILTTVGNSGTSMELTTTATYDTYGNTLSSVMTGTGVKPITTYSEYDTSGRFVTKTYSLPAAAVTSYTHDIWGNVLTESDITDATNALTTTHTYDNWGRLTSTLAPDGTKTEVRTGWGEDYSRKYYVMKSVTGSPWVLTWYDNAGHEIQQKSFGPKNVLVSKETTYNNKGLVSEINKIHGQQNITESRTYDNRGRIVSDRLSTGKETTYSYGNRTVTTSVGGRDYTKTYDAWGNIKESTDPTGNTVSYVYNSNGKPASVTTNGSAVSMAYDEAGNQTSLTDPDAGSTTYEYAADGKLLAQTDARGIVTTNTYDDLGRLSEVQIGENTIVNTYGTAGNEMLRLKRSTMGDNSVEYTYDRYGRVLTEKKSIAGHGNYIFSNEYDNNNRLAKTTYPGGLEVSYQYDNYGFKTQTSADGKTIYKLSNYNGLSTKTTFISDSLFVKRTKDANGFEKEAGIMQIIKPVIKPAGIGLMGKVDKIYFDPTTIYIDKQEQNYDPVTGNLLARKRKDMDMEVFGYDSLDRLVSVSECAATSVTATVDEMEETMAVTYAPNGNILSKTGIGNYAYSNDFKPHAVMSVDNAYGKIPSSTLITEFNDFGKIQTIEDEGGGKSMDFVYGPDMERWISSLTTNGDLSRTTIYAGDYEKITEDGNTREFYYLDGNTIIIKENGMFKPYLAFTDNLGSILTVVNDKGTKVFSASYDAWGNQTVTIDSIGLHRGYTGHEMLPEFGIINMNGRLYDSMLGRFFSPDNYIQMPDFSQSFNRYSYCLNNPLKYTDPSGEIAWFVAAALVGAAINVGIQAYNGNIHDAGDFLMATGIGAVAGVASAAVGMWLAPFAGGGFIGGAVSGFAIGTVGAAVEGYGNHLAFGTSMPSLRDIMASGVITAMTCGCIQGCQAVSYGGNFWTGKKIVSTPAVVAELNLPDSPETITLETKNNGNPTLRRLYQDTSNESLHIEHGRLPEDDVWKGMTSFERGEFGQRLVVQDIRTAKGELNFVKEVYYKINGTTYRADWSYIDKDGVLHIVEVKSGANPRLTLNQKTTIPALLQGRNVKIVPYGAAANKLYPRGVPRNIADWSFDMYWFQK